MGIQGAALATFMVVLVFSFLKILFLRHKMKMQPFTLKTAKLLILILLLYLVFNFVALPVDPFLSICIKSILLGLIFVFLVIKLKLSNDMNQLFNKLFKV
jgi:O-antigen/teichoic acid export membrane protein